jgi:hypothetical protein
MQRPVSEHPSPSPQSSPEMHASPRPRGTSHVRVASRHTLGRQASSSSHALPSGSVGVHVHSRHQASAAQCPAWWHAVPTVPGSVQASGSSASLQTSGGSHSNWYFSSERPRHAPQGSPGAPPSGRHWPGSINKLQRSPAAQVPHSSNRRRSSRCSSRYSAANSPIPPTYSQAPTSVTSGRAQSVCSERVIVRATTLSSAACLPRTRPSAHSRDPGEPRRCRTSARSRAG